MKKSNYMSFWVLIIIGLMVALGLLILGILHITKAFDFGLIG